jgi:hypothetical protein
MLIKELVNVLDTPSLAYDNVYTLYFLNTALIDWSINEI